MILDDEKARQKRKLQQYSSFQIRGLRVQKVAEIGIYSSQILSGKVSVAYLNFQKVTDFS